MATTHKAGTLILTNIGMFNEAVYHFGYEVDPKIREKIDEKISTFANKNDWVGKFQLHSDDEDCWVAPKNWNLAEEGDDLDVKAKLEIDYIADDDEDDYWIALFCGEGRKGGEAGFSFTVVHAKFGGKKPWNTRVSSLDSKLIKDLEDIGFRNRGKGSFFLPVRLDATKLASAWEDVQQDFDEALEPFDLALEKLKKAKPIFDQIIK